MKNNDGKYRMNTPIPYTAIPKMQIDEAIRLYRRNDFICSYTLAGAAEGVLTGILNKELQIYDTSFEHSRQRIAEMFDLTKDEVGKFLRINRNALNHYTPEQKENIKIGATETRGLIYRAIYDYSRAEGAGITLEMQRFVKDNQREDD